jgi:hypothetical protein
MRLLSSVFATETAFALSAAVSGLPSERANTMIAAVASTWLACGNARACRFCALIDS